SGSWGVVTSSFSGSAAVPPGVRPLTGSAPRRGLDCQLYCTSGSAAALSAGSIVGSVPGNFRPLSRALRTGFGGSNTLTGWVEPNGDIMVYGAGVGGYTAGLYLGGSYLAAH